MPVREKRVKESRFRSLRVPSHVPSHPQTAANARGFSHTAPGFTAETDWLLEGTGFEPPVPLLRKGLSAVARGDRQAGSDHDVQVVLGDDDCSPRAAPPRPSLSRPERWFETVFLQRRVVQTIGSSAA
jgi:hypothetical protein